MITSEGDRREEFDRNNPNTMECPICLSKVGVYTKARFMIVEVKEDLSERSIRCNLCLR